MSMEDGELPPSPVPSESPQQSNGANRFDESYDDVVFIEEVPTPTERRVSGRSTPLFDFDIGAHDDSSVGPAADIELPNVSLSNQSSVFNVRRSLSSSCFLTFSPSPLTPNSAKKRSKPTCFNCEGDHLISNCPLPHDKAKIRDSADRHRRESLGTPRHNRSQPATPNAGSVSDEKGYRPGRMSSGLLEALGLRSNDIPAWIYRMRKKGFMDGYPPSYLKKATLQSDDPSSLLSFNFIDDKLNEEEDETEQSKSFVAPRLDRRQIIYYGGFNKHFYGLNDLETFRVPVFDTYVDELEKHMQQKAASEWDMLKRNNSRKRKMFSCSGDEPSPSSNEQPSAKRGRIEEVDIPSSNDTFNDDDADASLLSINEASMSSELSEDTTIGLEMEGTEFPIPEAVNSTPFNGNAADLSRFSVGIQPFQATIEDAQSSGKFLKSLMSIIKNRAGDGC